MIPCRAYQSGVDDEAGRTRRTNRSGDLGAPPPANAVDKEKEAEKTAPQSCRGGSRTVKRCKLQPLKPRKMPEKEEVRSATAVSTGHQLTLQTSKKSSWVRVTVVDDGHEKQC